MVKTRTRATSGRRDKGAAHVPLDAHALSPDRPFDRDGHELLEALISSEVTLVKVGYLRGLAQQKMRLPRCQELPRDPPEGLRGFRTSTSVRGEDLRRQLGGGWSDLFVVSHAWLTVEHPDPLGARLREIVDELDFQRARNTDLVFLDYCSLPQVDKLSPDYKQAVGRGEALPVGHPAARTAAEDRSFELAISKMDIIFGSGKSKVLVFSHIDHLDDFDHVDDLDEFEELYKTKELDYRYRGWCCFEYSMALLYGRLANEPPKEMATYDPLSLEELVSAGKVFFSSPGDATKVLNIYKRSYFAGKLSEVLLAIEEGKADQRCEAICHTLRAHHAGIRERAVKALGQHRCDSFVHQVAPLLQDPEASVRVEACQAVCRMASSESRYIAMAVGLLKDPHYAVRIATLVALGDIGPAAACHRQAVADCMSDPFWEVREAAMNCLGNMGDALSLHAQTVAGCLRDETPITRAAALTSLLRIGPDAAPHADQVYKLATLDRYFFVRSAATRTLVKMGRGDLVQHLLDEEREEHAAALAREAAAAAGVRPETPL